MPCWCTHRTATQHGRNRKPVFATIRSQSQAQRTSHSRRQRTLLFKVQRRSQTSSEHAEQVRLTSNIVQCRLLTKLGEDECSDPAAVSSADTDSTGLFRNPLPERSGRETSTMKRSGTIAHAVPSIDRGLSGAQRGPGAQGPKGWLTRRCHHDESHCQQEGSACRSRHKTHSVKEFPRSLEAQQPAFRGEGEDV